MKNKIILKLKIIIFTFTYLIKKKFYLCNLLFIFKNEIIDQIKIYTIFTHHLYLNE